MTPERKAQMAMAAMDAMIERIRLETAILKGDVVGIANHAKLLARHQAKVFASSSPAPDPQRTITVDVMGHKSFDVSDIVDAVEQHNSKASKT